MLHFGQKRSILVAGSYLFIAVHMPDLLTTDEFKEIVERVLQKASV